MSRIVEIVKRVLEFIPFAVDVLFVGLTVMVAAYGAIKAALEVPDFVKDRWDALRKIDYRVKTTVVKANIGEDQTQTIKLRTVRVHKKLNKIVLDRVPGYGSGPVAGDREVKVQPPHYSHRDQPTHYSVPGASSVVSGEGKNMFQIDFKPDEELEPHRDHSILLTYTLEKKLGEIFAPPFVEAGQPVGSERLVIEVYFPPKWRLKKDTASVITVDPQGKPIDTLDEQRARIKPYPAFDFRDGRGEIEYIRAVISRPPQDVDIRLNWEWEKTP
ncbi:MAG TPA: hypothetical protein VL523_19455 [Terriglobia bacterium]|nr:hypothetical protein [Terriglobia bacterium]